MGVGAKAAAQETTGILRRAQWVPLAKWLVHDPSGHFHSRLDLGVLCSTEPFDVAELPARSGHQSSQATEGFGEMAGERHHGHAGSAGSQKNGQQFRVRQAVGAVGQQAFPRAFVGGPV